MNDTLLLPITTVCGLIVNKTLTWQQISLPRLVVWGRSGCLSCLMDKLCLPRPWPGRWARRLPPRRWRRGWMARILVLWAEVFLLHPCFHQQIRGHLRDSVWNATTEKQSKQRCDDLSQLHLPPPFSLFLSEIFFPPRKCYLPFKDVWKVWYT